jgi:hypothetical protein
MRALLWAVCLCLASAAAQTQVPTLHKHEDEMREVMRLSTVDIADPLAVFAFVLNSLPERVKVYPTENYYYFRFTHNGVEYAGNIRLDASDRDQGKVQFAYYEQTTLWRDDTPNFFKVLDESNGVKLEKLARFEYRLTYRNKSVVFELNDLSNVKPGKAMAENERFIGPVFDESGVRFFLLYHPSIKNFLFVLDETVAPTDGYAASGREKRLLLGKRTGFVFYRDEKLERKILVGVLEDNARINNYFDGPFDQLPDNFIEGETLRDALIDIDPRLKGQIDRFGGTPDGVIRYMIAPYLLYKDLRDFAPFEACAARNRKRDEASYYRCFILDHTKQDLSARPGGGKP